MAVGAGAVDGDPWRLGPPGDAMAPHTTKCTPQSFHTITSEAERHEIYVVATHKTRDRSAAGPQGWVPYGTRHAWEPGRRVTLCGKFIAGWTVFWDRSFSARDHEVCDECVEASLPAEARARLAPRGAVAG